MGFTFSEHIGNGSITTFPFTFEGPDNGYFREDDIFVYVDDIIVPFTITGPTQVTLVEAPVDGAKVLIRRIMPIASPYTDFVRGNNFGQTNVNRSFQQQLFLTHELLDGYKPDGYYEKQGLDMGGYPISNVKDGVNPQDVATIAQLAALDPELGGNILTDQMVIDIESSKAHISSNGSSHSLVSTHIANTSNPHQTNAEDVNCIPKDNTVAYVPLLPYHPATRKFVEDSVSGAVGVTDHGELSGLGDDDHAAVYVSKTNTVPYTPSGDYHPATKKYVDDEVAGISVGGDVWEIVAEGTPEEYVSFKPLSVPYNFKALYTDENHLPKVAYYDMTTDVPPANRGGVLSEWKRCRKKSSSPADNGVSMSAFRFDYYPERVEGFVGFDVNTSYVTDSRLPYIQTGSHTGTQSVTTLTDTSANFSASLVGEVASNQTDGSYGTITAVPTSTSIEVSLTGGADNTWDTNDSYVVGSLEPEMSFQTDGASLFGLWNFVVGPKFNPHGVNFRGLLGCEFNVGEREGDFGPLDFRTDTTWGDAKFSAIVQLVPEGIAEGGTQIPEGHNNSFGLIFAPQNYYGRMVGLHTGMCVERNTMSNYGVGVKLAGLFDGLAYTEGGNTVFTSDAFGYHLSGTSTTLTDTAYWFDGAMVGKTLQNITTGASGIISSVIGHTATAALSGGTRNTWEEGDRWVVTNGRSAPYAGVKLLNKWQVGMDTREATFTSDNIALLLADDHKVRFGDSSVYSDSSKGLNLFSPALLKLNAADIAQYSTSNNTYATGSIYTSAQTDLQLVGRDGAGRLKMYNNGSELIEIVSDEYVNIQGDDASISVAGSSGSNNMRVTPTYNYLDQQIDLGLPGYRFRNVYALGFYDNGGGYNDTLDDLQILHDMKSIGSDPEHLDEFGLEVQDVHSLPEHMTNKRDLVNMLVQDNPGMITEEEAAEFVDDPDDMGSFKQRHIGKFADITAGAVRQLDIKTDKSIKALTNRIEELESKLEEALKFISIIKDL